MLRRRLGERRIGHAGTLDPSATGVLVVGVGTVDPAAALRRRRPQALHRRGRARRGDGLARRRRGRRRHPRHGRRDARRRPPCGRPSTSSATSSRCRRWSRRSASTAGACTSWPARASRSSAGPRPVTVEAFDVTATDDPAVLAIDVVCSSGTYVRTLAADLGAPARRRCPPAQPAAHGGRAVHDRRGRAARGVRAAGADRGRAGHGHGRRRRRRRGADRQRAGAAGARTAPGRGR